MTQSIQETLRKPGNEFRGAPFWAWNGSLDPETLKQQIRIMHQMGLGGFFMHARVGLDTPFLSEEWFECIQACLEEADELDMRAWLYDEDRWPSGSAGGYVTANPAYRARSIQCEPITRPRDLVWTDDTVAVFEATLDDKVASDVRRLKKNETPAKLAKGRTLLRCHVVVDSPSDWFNGQTYLDTLNTDAVAEFIEVAYKPYAARYADQCGPKQRIPGIFTDEPNYGHGGGRTRPWTGALLRTYKQRYGSDLADTVWELFYQRPGAAFSQTRMQFYDCVTHLFVTAFAKQIGDWCAENNLEFTGHVLLEDTLLRQTYACGSAMRFYEHMQAPGMDLLTEYWRVYDTAKQVSSVARQCDRRWRLTETYGCTGWDFPLEGHKALGDWQAAMGINLRCQHLSWYTMKGEAKRDYPACIFHQSPWYDRYAAVEDYFARIHSVMTRGKEVRDVLVIQPLESVWGTIQHYDVAQGIDDDMRAVRDTLLGHQIDFDYGDEEMLSRLAKVSKKNQTVSVAKVKYSAIVLPSMITVRSSTLKLVQRFADAGGMVVFAGTVADHVDGCPSTEAMELAARCVRATPRSKKMIDALEPVARRVSVTQPDGSAVEPALILQRHDADAHYLFLCNTSHSHGQLMRKPVTADVGVRDRKASFDEVTVAGFTGAAGKPVEVDLRTGELIGTRAKRKAGGWSIETSLPRFGSRLFIVPKEKSDAKSLPAPKQQTVLRRKTLQPKQWTAVLSEPNVLVLDRPTCAIDGGPVQLAADVMLVDRTVRDALGIAHRGGRMVQPWAQDKPTNPKHVSAELRYTFDVRQRPTGPLKLAMENLDTCTVTLNGQPVPTTLPDGWWVDPSLETISLASTSLRTGANELCITVDYDETHSGLEMVYLLGDFGTKLQGTATTLTAPVRNLKLGNVVKQGLTFYSGHVGYRTTIRPTLARGEKLWLSVDRFAGAGLVVYVDGAEVAVLPWGPYEVDLTSALKGKKSAELTIEVLGNRRNSHGPLHDPEAYPVWTSSDRFIPQQDEYNLKPVGLLNAPVLEVRR